MGLTMWPKHLASEQKLGGDMRYIFRQDEWCWQEKARKGLQKE
jgi:hypothetical protein